MNRKNSKKLIAGTGLLCLLSLLLTSCLKSNPAEQAPATALVSFFQASPDQPLLDFDLNTTKINSLGLSYGNHLDYFTAYAGQRVVNIFNYGTLTAIVSASETLNPSTAYSIFLANKATSPEIIMLTDTLVKPPSGFASIRLVNVSPDAPAVDLAVQGGSVVVSNKMYKGYSGFVQIQGNPNYTFNILKAGTSTVLATLPNVQLTNGAIYTVWLHGLAGSTTSADNLTAGLVTNAYFN